MLLQQAKLEHLEEVAVLFDQYRVWYRQESDLEGARSFIKERIEKRESVIFIAQDIERKILGFVQLYPIFSSVSMERSWLLNDLFVHEDFRGRGIGKFLIRIAKNLCYAYDSKGLLLETEADNKVAQALYEKTGFTRESNLFYFWKKEE